MSLQNWLNNGWLAEHRTSPQEIAALLAVADRDRSIRLQNIRPQFGLEVKYRL